MTRPSTNGDNGRNAGGRFAKGNAGGPGNPFARRVAQLRSLIVETITDDDMAAIVRRLVEDAKNGDKAALKMLLSYAIGTPTGPVCEPDDVEVHDMRTATAMLSAESDRKMIEVCG